MKKLTFSLLFLFSIVGFGLADKTIVLAPGWNVVSTPKLLSGINFSNGGSGISFYTLSGSSWASIAPTVQTIKPLEGFVVNNSTNGDVIMSLLYRTNLNPMDILFQKTLNIGWNLLGITTITNPFTNIGNGAVMSVDFTKSTSSNILNGVNSSFTVNNSSSSVASPELGEAYGIFIASTGAIYGGSQDTNENSGNNQYTLISSYGDSPNNDYYRFGSTSKDLISFGLNSSGTTSKIKQIHISLFSGNIKVQNGQNILTNISLFSGNTLLSTKSIINGDVIFSDLNFNILNNQSKNFLVKGDIYNGADLTIGTPYNFRIESIDVENIENGNTIDTNIASTGYGYFGISDNTNIIINRSNVGNKLMQGITNNIAEINISVNGDSVYLKNLYLINNLNANLEERILSANLSNASGDIAQGNISSGGIEFEGFNYYINDGDNSRLYVNLWTTFPENTGYRNYSSLQLSLSGFGLVETGTIGGVRFLHSNLDSVMENNITGYNILMPNIHKIVKNFPIVSLLSTTTTNSRLMNFSISTKSSSTPNLLITGFKISIRNQGLATGTIKLYKDTVSSNNLITTGNIYGDTGSNKRDLTLSFNSLEIQNGQTNNFIFEMDGYLSNNLTREFSINDLSYIDTYEDGYNILIDSIKDYSNINLPIYSSYQP